MIDLKFRVTPLEYDKYLAGTINVKIDTIVELFFDDIKRCTWFTVGLIRILHYLGRTVHAFDRHGNGTMRDSNHGGTALDPTTDHLAQGKKVFPASEDKLSPEIPLSPASTYLDYHG